MKSYTIDAKDKKLGRIASEAAKVLMGKDEPQFERHEIAAVKVLIEHASQMAVDEKKLDQKTYTRYSGYPGGLKSATMSEVVAKKGYGEVLRHAIKGMLPKNTHRDRLMRQLIITE